MDFVKYDCHHSFYFLFLQKLYSTDYLPIAIFTRVED